jgi:flagellar brake protein
MLSDPRPSASTALEISDAAAQQVWAEFRITHVREQLRMFEKVRDLGVPVVLHATDGKCVTTKLWEVEGGAGGQRLSFAVDALAPVTTSLVDANEGSAVSYLESIKLQFDLHGLVLVRSPEGSMLQSSLPREMYRFQRRNAYRVRTTSRHEPVAKFRHPSLPDMNLNLHVLDLSIGGCALWLPHDVPALQSGTELGQVHVELDAESHFVSAARLQHLGALQGIDSATSVGKGRRIGCAWQGLPGSSERVLQRWIDRAQQRSRLLAAG